MWMWQSEKTLSTLHKILVPSIEAPWVKLVKPFVGVLKKNACHPLHGTCWQEKMHVHKEPGSIPSSFLESMQTRVSLHEDMGPRKLNGLKIKPKLEVWFLKLGGVFSWVGIPRFGKKVRPH